MEQEVMLLTELMQGITRDVATLKTMVSNQPQPAAPVDIRPTLEQVAQALQGVRQDVRQLASKPVSTEGAPDLRPQLEVLRQELRQRPEYRMSQYVQYGAYAFGLMVVLLVGISWLAFDWRQERDQYAQSYTWANWRLRYLKQAEPQYYQAIEGKFNADANGVGQWIEQQEQADATREAARQAAEQAAALTKQANQLEGKKNRTR